MQTQELQAERNSRSRGIGKAKAAGEDIAPLLKEVEGLGDQLKDKEEQLASLQDELNAILMGIPNIPHESVPDGKGEDDNPKIRTWGERPDSNLKPKTMWTWVSNSDNWTSRLRQSWPARVLVLCRDHLHACTVH